MKTNPILVMLILFVSCLGPHRALAGEHTADQLINAGFDCFNTGPSNWVHCMDLDKLINGMRSVPVKVFSEDGSEYLGTELLLHEDVYAGQPCPQDDLNVWGPVDGAPYMACHHFLTGHH